MGVLRPKLGHTLADTKIQSVKDVCALFGRKESNSARRANTARLRVIAKEEYGEGGSHDYTQGFVSSKVLLRLRLLRRRHGNISSQMKFATLREAMCYIHR